METLATLVVNKARVLVCAIKAPGFGDRRKAMLQDIAVLTGGQLISEEVGLSLAVSLDMMGVARKVTIDKESTIVAGGETKADVQKRIGQIRSSWKRPTLTTTKKLQERIAKLAWSCGD